MNIAAKASSLKQALVRSRFGPMIRRLLKLFRSRPEHGEFWTQKLNLKRFYDRKDYIFPLCQGRKVIHFGCTDYPVFKPHSNLHIQLSTITKELHGFDIDLKGIEELKKYVNQPFFSSYDELKNKHYDICIVPETIEHVDNIREFLENLRHVDADVFILTAPNCFCKEHIKRNSFKDGVFNEIVHPDHNCWFSPYTLKNAIEKYSSLTVRQVYLLGNDTMVCCEAVKKSN
jgi:hypothetical protein